MEQLLCGQSVFSPQIIFKTLHFVCWLKFTCNDFLFLCNLDGTILFDFWNKMKIWKRNFIFTAIPWPTMSAICTFSIDNVYSWYQHHTGMIAMYSIRTPTEIKQLTSLGQWTFDIIRHLLHGSVHWALSFQ